MKNYNLNDPLEKRLVNDYNKIVALCENSDLISFEIINPIKDKAPDHFMFCFNVKSIVGIDLEQQPLYGNSFNVEIQLPSGYPIVSPICYLRSPIWHPNIRTTKEPVGHICINAQALGSWQSLDMLILHIGEMLQYKNYHALNTPPFPEDSVVAEWVRDFAEPNLIVHSEKRIVVDDRPLIRTSPKWDASRNKSNKIRIKKINLVSNNKQITIEKKSTNTIRIIHKK